MTLTPGTTYRLPGGLVFETAPALHDATLGALLDASALLHGAAVAVSGCLPAWTMVNDAFWHVARQTADHLRREPADMDARTWATTDRREWVEGFDVRQSVKFREPITSGPLAHSRAIKQEGQQ